MPPPSGGPAQAPGPVARRGPRGGAGRLRTTRERRPPPPGALQPFSTRRSEAMSGALRLWLSPEPRAPRAARRALEDVDGLDDGVRATAALLTSELVTNAVRHAQLAAHERIEVTISIASVLRIEVAESGPGPAGTRLAADGDDEHGRGLLIVARLARRWGIDRDQPGRVWFELDLGSADGDGDGAVRRR